MKKTITILIAAILCAVALSLAVTAAGNVSDGIWDSEQQSVLHSGTFGSGDALRWTLYDGGLLIISGQGDVPDYASGENKPWTSYRNSIRALAVREGVTAIGSRAFQRCQNMEQAVIADSVTSIGAYAFQNCYALSRVTVPDGAVTGTGAFRGSGVEYDALARESDAYAGSKYFRQLQEVVLTGNYREDIIAVARSQFGYHEGDSLADLDGANSSGTQDYTEYGRYLGSQGSAWCSEFTSWCIRMAGVPTTVVATSRGASATGFTGGTSGTYYTWEETVYGGGSYMPRKGDIVLMAATGSSYTSSTALAHSTILESVTDNGGATVRLNIVNGNSGNSARSGSYTVTKATGVTTGSTQVGYIVSPNYEETVPHYTLWFDANGGTVPTSSKTVAQHSIYGVLPPAEKAGHTFVGWYTAPVDGTRVYMWNSWRGTEDQTLYAHFDLPGAVARLKDGSQYLSLQAAVDAAPEDGTVTLLADVTENVVVAAGKELTIDFQGHTLTNSTEGAYSSTYVPTTKFKNALSVYGTVTLINNAAGGNAYNLVNETTSYLAAVYPMGKLTVGSADEAGVVKLSNTTGYTFGVLGGELVIENAAVTSNISKEGSIFRIPETTTLMGDFWTTYAADSRITVNGGSFTHSHSKNVLLMAYYGSIEISGGDFNGDVTTGTGALTISGGTFAAGKSFTTRSAAPIITGGTFNGGVAFSTEAEHFISGGQFTSINCSVVTTKRLDANYMLDTTSYAVVLREFVATNGTSVGAVTTLLNAADSGTTVTLLQNGTVAFNETVVLSSGATLDLKGHTLTVSGNLFAAGEITDSVGGGTLVFMNDNYYFRNDAPGMIALRNREKEWDDEASAAYTFYSYTTKTFAPVQAMDQNSQPTDTAVFYFRPDFGDAAAYELLARGWDQAGLKMSLLLRSNALVGESINLALSDAILKGFAANVLANPDKPNRSITIMVKNLRFLKGEALTLTPVLQRGNAAPQELPSMCYSWLKVSLSYGDPPD